MSVESTPFDVSQSFLAVHSALVNGDDIAGALSVARGEAKSAMFQELAERAIVGAYRCEYEEVWAHELRREEAPVSGMREMLFRLHVYKV